MSDSFVIPWTVASQVTLSMGFPRQEYWSGLPFPSLRELPNPGIEPASPALAGGFFTNEPPGKPSTNLLPFVKMIYKLLSLITPLGLLFISLNFSYAHMIFFFPPPVNLVFVSLICRVPFTVRIGP